MQESRAERAANAIPNLDRREYSSLYQTYDRSTAWMDECNLAINFPAAPQHNSVGCSDWRRNRQDGRQTTCHFSAAHPQQSKATFDQKSWQPHVVLYVHHMCHTDTVDGMADYHVLALLQAQQCNDGDRKANTAPNMPKHPGVVFLGTWTCCSWLHTRWWSSLVSDPIIHGPWSVLFGKGMVFVCSSKDVEHVKGLENTKQSREMKEQRAHEEFEHTCLISSSAHFRNVNYRL